MVGRLIQRYHNNERFVVFDVETVGASNNSIIVEIGAVEAGKNYGKEFRSFQKILRYCPDSWDKYSLELSIHKIPPRKIEQGEDRCDVLRDFLDFVDESTLICHTNFDIRATRGNLSHFSQLQYAKELPLWDEFIDSFRIARKICPNLPSYSLANLANHFSIQNPQAHRALADAMTTKKIVGKLIHCHMKTPHI